MKTAKPKSFKKIIYIIMVLVALVLIGLFGRTDSSTVKWLSANQPGLYRVIHVDDGDTITIEMNGLPERVRFIGVDTPELHHPERPVECFAEEAKKFTSAQIGNYKVRLVADPLDDNRDLYGRLLRYVYLPDGKLLNLEIVKQGYGFAYTHFPFEKSQEVELLGQSARQAARGLWSACQVYLTDRGYQTNPVKL